MDVLWVTMMKKVPGNLFLMIAGDSLFLFTE